MEYDKCEREAIKLLSEERFGTLETNERRWYAQLSDASLRSMASGAWQANDVGGAQRVKLERIRRGTLTLEDANKTWPEIKAEWLWT